MANMAVSSFLLRHSWPNSISDQLTLRPPGCGQRRTVAIRPLRWVRNARSLGSAGASDTPGKQPANACVPAGSQPSGAVKIARRDALPDPVSGRGAL